MKNIIKAILKRMLYAGGCYAFPKETRILFYHSIDDSGSPISTSVKRFETHMAYLKERQYHTISLADYVNNMSQDKVQSEKLVLVTFDDGFKSTYLHAFPILKKYGFIATVFLVTDYMNGLASWMGRDLNLIEDRILNSPKAAKELQEIKEATSFPLLTWDEIKEMCEYGIEFGSHTASHLWLGETRPKKVREDISKSKLIIEEQLNKPVDFFSYPYSDYAPETKEIVRELGFKAACGGDPRVDRSDNDLYGLKRTGPVPAESFFEFKFIFSVAYDWYIRLVMRLRGVKRDEKALKRM